MPRCLSQPQEVESGWESKTSTLDSAAPPLKTRSEEFAQLEICSDRPEGQEAIRRAISEKRLRVVPDPKNPALVRIVPANG